jgi:hypothetical protein
LTTVGSLSASGCGPAPERGARSGSGFGTAGHCRNRPHGSQFSVPTAPFFLGRHLFWRRRKLAGVSQSHRSPKGNRQMRRILIRKMLPLTWTAALAHRFKYRRLVPHLGTQSNHRGDCPSHLPTHLASLSSRGALGGTRTGRPREFETSTNDENDPPTPKPWLSRRTAGTEPCIGSEEFSTLLGTRQKRPGFGPALFSAVQLKVLRTPAAAQAAGRAVCHRRC